jgi:general secretion pathway protein D
VLRVRADRPFLRNYKIDYVNMKRGATGVVRVATTIGSAGQADIGDSSSSSSRSSGSRGNQGDNSSLTEINNESENMFWDTLAGNIQLMLQENKQLASSDGGATGSVPETATRDELKDRVIVNRETGIIAVRATSKQHAEIQTFLDMVLNNARRQVMIEATIAEIKLSDRYQAGVDWSLISSDPTSGVNFVSDLRDGNLGQSPFSSLAITDTVSGDQLSMTIKALERFGDVKVLSSPKVMAINNQPAILKVVDNFVYFEMDVDTQANDNVVTTTFDTEIKTVPVGFVMSVTPYISDADVVTLNIRPTISRVIDKVNDPNPEFANASVISEIPVIQVREIESVLQVNSGDTAIIGGLMQDTVNDVTSGVPFLSSIPIIGGLFSYKDDQREKSELVIFIRPIVVKHASLNGDLSEFQKFLPAGKNDTTAQD